MQQYKKLPSTSIVIDKSGWSVVLLYAIIKKIGKIAKGSTCWIRFCHIFDKIGTIVKRKKYNDIFNSSAQQVGARLNFDLMSACRDLYRKNCILVDPASCHMLVSKIKPCMSKYTLWHSETANGSLNQLWFIRSCNPNWIPVVILELIHATGPNFTEGRFY